MLSTAMVEQCAFVCEKLFMSWWTPRTNCLCYRRKIFIRNLS